MDYTLDKIFIFIVYLSTAVVHSQVENRAPTWINDLRREISTGVLSEDLPKDTVIGTLKAVDPDGDPVTYECDNDIFEVHPTTGVVILKKQLDYENAHQNLQVTFTASDNLQPNPNRSPRSLTIVLMDVNDNKPEFIGIPYKFTVMEDTPVDGSVLYDDITIKDKDKGLNADVTLSCYPSNSQACEFFEVEQVQLGEGHYQGLIKLKKALDYETTRSYTLTVLAMNGALNESKNVVITVGDVQDAPPRFLGTPITMNVIENAPFGQQIKEIRAEDQDVGNPNPIQFKIVNDPLGFFRLTPTRLVEGTDGVYRTYVISSGNIDRDKLPSITYTATLQAVEISQSGNLGNSTDADITVEVGDINDNNPEFSRSNYEFNVREGLRVNTTLPNFDVVVEDNDLGTNADFVLRLLSNPRGTFKLSSGQDRYNRRAQVVLAVAREENMDYEKPEFRKQVITVEAIGIDGNSTTATVTINLVDENDNNPKFSRSQYQVEIKENMRVGTDIQAGILATDADSGRYGRVTYNLTGANSNYFNIDRNSGVVTLARPVDYENQRLRVFPLEITATDGGGRFSIASLTITVLNHNDKPPQFEQTEYRTSISERTGALNPPIRIIATDTDSGARVTYSIIGGNTQDRAFRIDQNTGVITLLRNITYRETNNGKITLQIMATEHSNPSLNATATVDVTIVDENDFPPKFERRLYTGQVTELSRPNMPVATVRATDEDAGVNGQIRYQIFTGSRDNFYVDSSNGTLYVSPTADLDRDKFGSSYDIVILAIDSALTNRQTATTTVRVTVRDSNNKLPYFEQDTYFGSVEEETTQNREVMTVSATDHDTSKNLRYTIVANSFKAKDSDGNDILPTTQYNFRGAFSVDHTSGKISTAFPRYERDRTATISFIIKVEDTNAENPRPQTATATAQINIIRTQAGDPVFDPPWLPTSPIVRFTLSEGQTKEGYEVVTLVARNPNDNSAIDNFQEVANSDLGNNFRVNQRTGQVILNRHLDYETVSNREVSVQVRATSEHRGEIRTSTAQIVVILRDDNDNDPIFENQPYSFSVNENSGSDILVGRIRATDKDSAQFGRIRFSLSGQRASDFKIDPDQGHINVAPGASLDRETFPTYNLIVTAVDGGGNVTGRIKTEQVVITLDDVNDNHPKFEQNPYIFYTFNTEPQGTNMGRVMATDDDVGDNKEIVYSIIRGNGQGLFTLHQRDGVITNLQPLENRARDEPYDLIVQAEDRGSPSLTNTTTVRIVVRKAEEGDRKPTIVYPARDGMVFFIEEETQNNTFVVDINATDLDPGPAGEIEYLFLPNKDSRDHSFFWIDSKTGTIRTNGKRLDREQQETYELIVIARDHGSPPRDDSRLIKVVLTDINDQAPTYRNCRDLSNPSEASVLENEPPKTVVFNASACDTDRSPNNNIRYKITCDSSKGEVFAVDPITGVIYTNKPINRETIDRYNLCIQAVDPQNKFPDAPDSTLNVDVKVKDVDDNGPTFNQPTEITAAVMVNAPYQSEVIRIVANDPDIVGRDLIEYSIIPPIKFIRYGVTTNDPGAFTVDKRSGSIKTNKVNYIDDVGGYFKFPIRVIDGQRRSDTVTVNVYVIRENQKLKFTFKDPPEIMKDRLNDFTRELIATTNMKIETDPIQHHVDSDNKINEAKSDVCFHAVRDLNVIQTQDTETILSHNNPNVKKIYDKYGMEFISSCTSRLSTTSFGGLSPLWWILIVLAVLIALIALALILALCCCWSSYKKQLRAHPFPAYLPEATNPIMRREFEWQESSMQVGEPGPPGYGSYTYQVSF